MARLHAKAASKALAIWKAATPARADHPYLTLKGVAPVAALREIPANETAAILGYAPKSQGKPLAERLLGHKGTSWERVRYIFEQVLGWPRVFSGTKAPAGDEARSGNGAAPAADSAGPKWSYQMHADASYGIAGKMVPEPEPEIVHYSRGRDKHDAYPEQRTAASFEAFVEAVLSDR
jgi:hypothetical protein